MFCLIIDVDHVDRFRTSAAPRIHDLRPRAPQGAHIPRCRARWPPRRPDASCIAHGLALALPEKVVMARPTGVGRALATYEIPIDGRDEWMSAVRPISTRK